MDSLGSGFALPLPDFAYVRKQLGNKIIDDLPIYNPYPSDLNIWSEGDYPKPWKNAEDMPYDAFKGVYPSGRPFIAVRYFLEQYKEQYRLYYEIFFQRHGSEWPWNWSSADNGGSIHRSGGMQDKHYKVLKNLLEGKEADRRVLPKFCEKLVVIGEYYFGKLYSKASTIQNSSLTKSMVSTIAESEKKYADDDTTMITTASTASVASSSYEEDRSMITTSSVGSVSSSEPERENEFVADLPMISASSVIDISSVENTIQISSEVINTSREESVGSSSTARPDERSSENATQTSSEVINTSREDSVGPSSTARPDETSSAGSEEDKDAEVSLSVDNSGANKASDAKQPVTKRKKHCVLF